MTLTQKLTAAIRLYKSLNKCFTTNENVEFSKLTVEILADGVDAQDFLDMMKESIS